MISGPPKNGFPALLGRVAAIRVPPPPVVAVILVLFLLLLRLPALLDPTELNPDESQFLAQGMKFLRDPVPWRSVDGGSSGPLNSYLVTLFLLAGSRPGYFLAHALASLLLALQVLVVHRTLLRLTSEKTAALGMLMAVLSYGLCYSNDLKHYSSELLPALLLASGFYCFVVWLDTLSGPNPLPQPLLPFLIGLALGAAPWCKLQALPISGALGLVILMAIAGNGGRPPAKTGRWQLVAFCLGGLLPAGIILSVTAWSHAIEDFWYSYILANLLYGGRETWVQTLLDCWRALTFRADLPISLLTVTAAGITAIIGFQERVLPFDTKRRWALGALAVYAGAALFAVVKPATLFVHYVVFLIFPLSCLGSTMASRASSREGKGSFRKAAAGVLLAVAALMAAVYAQTAWRYTRQTIVQFQTQQDLAPSSDNVIANEIRVLGQTRAVGSLVILGWAPGVYVLTGIPPATRNAVVHDAVSQRPMQGYFRSRFLGDLRAAMPDLFIDADAPGCFWDDGGGYESDRELRTFIDDHYDLVADVPLVSGLKPVRIWRRREFATKNGIRP